LIEHPAEMMAGGWPCEWTYIAPPWLLTLSSVFEMIT
jgi:hypothetical protein